MISRRNREYIAVQLLETQRMLAQVGNHPLMSVSLKQKEKELLAELDRIPVDKKDTRVTLLFSGNPVIGSLGIDAAFAGKVAVPFQNMVTAEFAHRVYGKVGRRGQVKNEQQSRLFLTGLPRGSFGLELSKLESSDETEDEQLANSLSHIARLVESSAKSDEDFAAELDETTPRTIQNLKDFLKVISDEHAGITIESGGLRCDLSIDSVRSAVDRVGGTITTEKEITVTGMLKGVLLESWKFDFTGTDKKTFSGSISESLSEKEVSDYSTQFFNKQCTAILREGKVLFKNGREKISYTLLSIQ